MAAQRLPVRLPYSEVQDVATVRPRTAPAQAAATIHGDCPQPRQGSGGRDAARGEPSRSRGAAGMLASSAHSGAPLVPASAPAAAARATRRAGAPGLDGGASGGRRRTSPRRARAGSRRTRAPMSTLTVESPGRRRRRAWPGSPVPRPRGRRRRLRLATHVTRRVIGPGVPASAWRRGSCLCPCDRSAAGSRPPGDP